MIFLTLSLSNNWKPACLKLTHTNFAFDVPRIFHYINQIFSCEIVTINMLGRERICFHDALALKVQHPTIQG